MVCRTKRQWQLLCLAGVASSAWFHSRTISSLYVRYGCGDVDGDADAYGYLQRDVQRDVQKDVHTDVQKDVQKDVHQNYPRIPTQELQDYYEALRAVSLEDYRFGLEQRRKQGGSGKDGNEHEHEHEHSNQNVHSNQDNNLSGRDNLLLYHGFMGLGHRLGRQAAAFHHASTSQRVRSPRLWVQWDRTDQSDTCGNPTDGANHNQNATDDQGAPLPDLFEYLFGVGPMVVDAGSEHGHGPARHTKRSAGTTTSTNTATNTFTFTTTSTTTHTTNTPISTNTTTTTTTTTTPTTMLREVRNELDSRLRAELDRANATLEAAGRGRNETNASSSSSLPRLLPLERDSFSASSSRLFRNDVGGYSYRCLRERLANASAVFDDRAARETLASHYSFYQQLAALFRFRTGVEDFAVSHAFSERTVVGVHVRTGNGEKGDFARKGRSILDPVAETEHDGKDQEEDEDNDQDHDQDHDADESAGKDPMEEWLGNLSRTVQRLIQLKEQHQRRRRRQQPQPHGPAANAAADSLPPLVFVATDDPLLVRKLSDAVAALDTTTTTEKQARTRKQKRPVVVSFSHKALLPPGGGVSFGATSLDRAACLEGWVGQVSDALLLGAADALVAARYSSFTQALPLAMVLGESLRNHEPGETNTGGGSDSNSNTGHTRFANRLFCEVNKPADGMRCYDDYTDWLFGERELYVSAHTPQGEAEESLVWNPSVEAGVLYQKQVFLRCQDEETVEEHRRNKIALLAAAGGDRKRAKKWSKDRRHREATANEPRAETEKERRRRKRKKK
ncbi:unnamed protein product [Pseudo-nitzschia multistriata]|uniref:Uncharacterized protein n=1 Tax=Pseudo-nitzschia multistriata TaxID=183589 RepID=A0A448Z7R7_9STRA|nr:unnamed protein product [Pseudo-nitzschia multistriata]